VPDTNALSRFWRLIKDYESIFGWIAKCGFVAPLFPMILNLGPPWGTGGSELMAKATVVLLTTIVQAMALIAAFTFAHTGLRAAGLSKLLKRGLFVAIAGLILYLGVFIGTTESPPHTSQRYVKGFLPSKAYRRALAQLNGDVDRAKDALGRRPLRIWVAWTVYVNTFLVNGAWLFFFGCLSFYIGAFAKALPTMTDVEVRSILELDLPYRLRRELEHAGISTIGDLVSKTRRELLQLDGIGKARIQEIEHALEQHALSLRT